MNNNGRCDDGEPSAVTGAGGAFTLTVGGFDPNAYPMVVEIPAGTVDEDDGPVAKGYTLRSPAGNYGFVSPLTTLIQTKIDQNPALDADAAAQIVGQKLNVEDPARLYTDYVTGEATETDLAELHQSARIVARAFGEVQETLAVNNVTGNLDSDNELRAVQVVTGKLLLEKLDQVAVAVQTGGDTLDPDTAAGELSVNSEADTIATEEISTIARQIAAIGNSGRSGAPAALPGKTVYSFEEDGTAGPHTLIEVVKIAFGESGIESMDAYDDEITGLEDLDGPGFPAGFTADGDKIVFSAADMITETHLDTTATVDLEGLRFRLGDLALTRMQDTDLRAREIDFAAGDLMYKLKCVYYPTDIAMAAEILVTEMAEEEIGYENGNSIDDLKAYADARNVNNPLTDHGVVLGPKTYLKYFVPAAPGSATGTLKAVLQGDVTDTITVGTYRIEALADGRAYIVMDLIGFAEVNGVWDHLLVVNDAGDNHNFWEVLIADTAGSKSAEILYFNRSAMEKIFSTVKMFNP